MSVYQGLILQLRMTRNISYSPCWLWSFQPPESYHAQRTVSKWKHYYHYLPINWADLKDYLWPQSHTENKCRNITTKGECWFFCLLVCLFYFSQNPVRVKEQGRTLETRRKMVIHSSASSVRLAEIKGKWITEPVPPLFNPQPTQWQRFRMHFIASICLQWPECFSCRPQTVISLPNKVHLTQTALRITWGSTGPGGLMIC